PAFSSLRRAIRALTTVVSSPPDPLAVLVLTPWPPLPPGEGERTSSPLSGTERGTGREDETRGAAAIVAATANVASAAQPRREAGLGGRRPSSSRAMRDTSSERRSARPATGTPRGDAWIHSATVARHFASETADPVLRVAHSSLRYSAVVSSSRRARRFKGWKKKNRSIRLAPASH